MNTVNDVLKELELLRANGDYDSFGVFYQSQSNRSNRHYVILKSDEQFKAFKESYKEYDFKFNKLGV